MESESINRRDAYGNLHGYWEWHFNLSNGYTLVLKGCYDHGNQYGCWNKYHGDVLTTMEYYL